MGAKLVSKWHLFHPHTLEPCTGLFTTVEAVSTSTNTHQKFADGTNTRVIVVMFYELSFSADFIRLNLPPAQIFSWLSHLFPIYSSSYYAVDLFCKRRRCVCSYGVMYLDHLLDIFYRWHHVETRRCGSVAWIRLGFVWVRQSTGMLDVNSEL